MRVLYALRSSGFIYYHGSIIKQLCRNGHTVHLLLDHVEHKDASGQVLQILREELEGFSFDELLRRNDLWRMPLFQVRGIIDYSRYLGAEGQSTSHLARYWRRFLPRWLRAATGLKTVRRMLARGSIQQRLQVVENLAPPDREITGWLERYRPDVVVASPMNWRYSEEVEYIKSAKALNIPTVVSVLSWDNLTTKGIFHVIPDLVLVWNRKQIEEASAFPGLTADRMIVTGAPPFDQWFDIIRPSVDRATFCQQVALDPDKPYVVYLGSGPTIGAPETWLVEELAGRLRASLDGQLREMNVLVRPHPANVKIYERISAENVRVWPKKPGLPQTRVDMECFYNTLYYAICTVGLNTSAMIDSIVADKPCVALVTAEYDSTQARMVHFQTLLHTDALESANSPAECVDMIAALMQGKDGKGAIRRQFVEEFIRPAGRHKPAGRLAAKAIEMASSRFSADQIKSALSSE